MNEKYQKYRKWIKPVSIALITLSLLIIFYMDNVSDKEDYVTDSFVEDTVDYEVDGNRNGGAEAFPAYYSPAPSTRTLTDYYSGRQFPGSPPVIPHPVSEIKGDFNCLSCHQQGGYVSRFEAYTPVTPHPQYVNCTQCHVEGFSDSGMAGFNAFNATGIDWMSVKPPKTKRTAIAGGPPPIPHTLQLRENCLSCHAGPAAVKQIRTTHPERVNCTQCHVPQQTAGVWINK